MATQKGRNWSSGDIVTAVNLSSIERGVSAVAEEYTPTTWANGNTVTAAGLNNIEQGIVNAGSSSDFSTAEVTVNAPANYVGADIYGAIINLQRALIQDPSNYSCSVDWITSGDGQKYTIILYKGTAVISLSDNESIISTSGLISFDADLGVFIVTGDCTITISDSSSSEVPSSEVPR